MAAGIAWADATLGFAPNPAALKPAAATEPLTIDLWIDSSEPVMGTEVVLRHDPTLVRVNRVDAGPFLQQNGGTLLNLSEYDNIAGVTAITLALTGANPLGVTGAGVLARLTLAAVTDDPTSVVTIESAALRDTTNSPIDWTGEDLSLERAAYTPTLTVSLSLPGARYGLVSVPLDLPEETRLSSVLDELGPPSPTTWRGFGLVGGALVEDPLMVPGAGIWLSVAGPLDSLRIEGPAAPDRVAIPLQPGWGAVGVPWPEIEFAWADARVCSDGDTLFLVDPAADGIIAPTVWWWHDSTPNHRNDGSYRAESVDTALSSASEDGGYLMLARTACTLLLVSTEGTPRPAQGVAASSDPHTGLKGPEWTFSLSATGGGGDDQVVELGACEGSSLGTDRTDVLLPPYFAEGLLLAVVQGEEPESHYMRAYAPSRQDCYEWTILVRGAEPVATLVWNGTAEVPDRLHAYLIDPVTGCAVDMRSWGSHEFALHGDGRRFLVRLQEERYRGRLRESSATAFRTVTPSPASGCIEVEYDLAHAGIVSLQLLDVSGRLVAQLDGGPRDAGTHRLSWHREPISLTGIHFLRLRNGNIVDVRRVVLVR